MARGRKTASLRKALAEQGRSVAWLARETGYSRGYVSNVLHDKTPFTEEFQRRAVRALKAKASVPVLYRGRTVQVPEDIYRRAAESPIIAVESVYEEAWKRSWIQEHGQSTLAIAAERAWQAASALGDDAA